MRLYKKATADKNSPANTLISESTRFRCTIEASANKTGVAITFIPHKSMAKQIPKDRGTPLTAQFAASISPPKKAYKNTVFRLIFNGIEPL